MSTYYRLTKAYEAAREISINDSSKIVFMSDCHRGDNSWADDFAHNQQLYFTALSQYYKDGFTYIEIGDGDELWKNKHFAEIRQAHSDVFWLLQKYYNQNRLYMIYGNHDIVKKYKGFKKSNLYIYYDSRKEKHDILFDNIEIYEALVLKHSNTGQKILAIHGHQGDIINDQLWPLGRFLVRYLWRPLSLVGLKDPTSPARNNNRKSIVEHNISLWAKTNKCMVIAGHTHRPVFPQVDDPPYFNDGSCVHPRCITAIEIENGSITLVKWSIGTRNEGTLFVKRDIIAGPSKVSDYF